MKLCSPQPDDDVTVLRAGAIAAGIVVGAGKQVAVLFPDGLVEKFALAKILTAVPFPSSTPNSLVTDQALTKH